MLLVFCWVFHVLDSSNVIILYSVFFLSNYAGGLCHFVNIEKKKYNELRAKAHPEYKNPLTHPKLPRSDNKLTTNRRENLTARA